MAVGKFRGDPAQEPPRRASFGPGVHRVHGYTSGGAARGRARPSIPSIPPPPPRNAALPRQSVAPQAVFPNRARSRSTDGGLAALDSSFRPESSRSSGRGRRRQRKDRRKSAIAFLLVIAVFALLALIGWWGYGKVRDFLDPPDYAGSGTGVVNVKVNDGDSISAIGNTLVRTDVVKSAAAFVNAAENDDRSQKLPPGTYQLRKKMSAAAALHLLLSPQSRVTGRFTAREGLSVTGTLKLISENTGISLDSLKAAAKDPARLGVPEWAKGNLEGFLFPNTYDVDASVSAHDALSTMVKQSLTVLNQLNFVQRSQQLGFEPYQVLTIASLAEMEGIPSDFGKIARVVYNRLAADMPLQFDSTTQYWLELNGSGRKKDKLSDNALRAEKNNYSTTVNRGLPPTAISNPSRAALEAALEPSAGDWLYFAATSQDGHSSFTKSPAEHERNVAVCRQKKLGC